MYSSIRKVVSILTLVIFICTNTSYGVQNEKVDSKVDLSEICDGHSFGLRPQLSFGTHKGLSVPNLLKGDETVKQELFRSDDRVKQAIVSELLELIEEPAVNDHDRYVDINFPILNLLSELVANDESAVVFISDEVLGKSEGRQKQISKISLIWAQTVNSDDYSVRLLLSALCFPESWTDFFLSVNRSLSEALSIVKRTKKVFNLALNGQQGYATTVIEGKSLKNVPDTKKIDITQMSEEYFVPKARKHRFTPEKLTAIETTLLGGTGTRYQQALKEDKEFADRLRHQLDQSVAPYMDKFKAALPVGDKPILALKLGDGEEIRRKVVILSAQDNYKEAQVFTELVIQNALTSGEKPNVHSFIQPIAPRRIPTRNELDKYFEREKKGNKPDNIGELYKYCDKYAGMIALGTDGKPILGPENHWDFIKFLMLEGIFIDLFEEATVNGELRDVILRISNQDNVASAVGKDRPVQIAINSLIDVLESENGLYVYLSKMDGLKEQEWESYKDTPEYKQNLRSKIGAVIEGAYTPGYKQTGGGVFNQGQFTMVCERSNIDIPETVPSVNITNSNTIEVSLLAICAMCGLRPKDISAMLKAKRETKDISLSQKDKITRGVEKAEVNYVPVRQQIRIKIDSKGQSIPIQGTERDVHGMLGRAFDTLLLLGDSMETYEVKMKGLDRALLEGKIDLEGYKNREAKIIRDLTFIPNKEFTDWRTGRRPSLALAKQLGFVKEFPVAMPDVVLSRIEEKTPFSFLKALVDEGYYLSSEELYLAKNYLDRQNIAYSKEGINQYNTISDILLDIHSKISSGELDKAKNILHDLQLALKGIETPDKIMVEITKLYDSLFWRVGQEIGMDQIVEQVKLELSQERPDIPSNFVELCLRRHVHKSHQPVLRNKIIERRKAQVVFLYEALQNHKAGTRLAVGDIPYGRKGERLISGDATNINEIFVLKEGNIEDIVRAESEKIKSFGGYINEEWDIPQELIKEILGKEVAIVVFEIEKGRKGGGSFDIEEIAQQYLLDPHTYTYITKVDAAKYYIEPVNETNLRDKIKKHAKTGTETIFSNN